MERRREGNNINDDVYSRNCDYIKSRMISLMILGLLTRA